MKRLVSFTINGRKVDVVADTRQTLLDLIREELVLFGTKEGCGNGNCGACTVLVDGNAVDSCLVLAVEAEGHDVTTIEGVAQGGKLHPVQQAFIDYGGLQCGFCTPGFIMSSVALLNKNPHPTEEEIRMAIAGNLCRCTGYDKIVRAIASVAEQGVRT